MTDSILDTVKKMLNIEAGDTDFDTDIVIHINSALGTLHQLGIGPAQGLFITDNSATWTDFIGASTHLNAVKTLVYLKVRLVFDPPTTSFGIQSFEKMAEELEFRLNVAAETPGTTFPPTPVVPSYVTVQNYDGSETEDTQIVFTLTQNGQDIDDITVEAS